MNTTNVFLMPEIVCANSSHMSAPIGHYSHVCIAGGLVHVSGQLPVDADGTPLVNHPFEEQAVQVLTNLDNCLARAGVSRSRLIQVRVYLTDVTHWHAFNRIYGEWIGDLHRPARAVVGIAALHFGLFIEVEATALAARI